MRNLVVLFVLSSACAGLPPSENERGPECAKSFVESQVPDPWDVQVYDLSDVALFTVQYGEAQDCPSGCFNSNGSGLMWTCDDLKWLHVNDYNDVTFPEGSMVTLADLDELGGSAFVERTSAKHPDLVRFLRRALERLERAPR